MNVRVLFLGPSRDFARTDETSLSLDDGATVGQARRALASIYPGLGPALPTIRFAVNQAFVVDTVVLAEDDELALIPPVSGG